MNTKRAMKWSLLVASAGCLAVASMPGCELLVTFDRSKIPNDGSAADATESDGEFNQDAMGDAGPGLDGQSPTPDGTAETGAADGPTTADTSTPDAGDGGIQGSSDAAVEAGTDAGGGTDSGLADAPADSGGAG